MPFGTHHKSFFLFFFVTFFTDHSKSKRMNKIETYRKMKTRCVRVRDRWDREKHRSIKKQIKGHTNKRT